MVIDALATERHYMDHLAPIWRALGTDAGFFWTTRNLLSYALLKHGIFASSLESDKVPGGGPVLVASWDRAEQRAVGEPTVLLADGPRGRPVVLLEHGAGQDYGDGHQSYAGGAGRQSVQLFLCPNESVAERNRKAYPEARAVVVGSPRLDRWVKYPRRPRETDPVVAISFHWDCVVAPETNTAWPHYRNGLAELASRYRLIGHGHPRIIDELAPFYGRLGIEVVRDFDVVLQHADVYVVDNSSSGIEAMAAGLALVWMNAPWYRRDIEHGGRFWKWTNGIPTVDGPEQLPGAIASALTDDPIQARWRQEIVQSVYEIRDGTSSQRAAAAIRLLLEEAA